MPCFWRHFWYPAHREQQCVWKDGASFWIVNMKDLFVQDPDRLSLKIEISHLAPGLLPQSAPQHNSYPFRKTYIKDEKMSVLHICEVSVPITEICCMKSSSAAVVGPSEPSPPCCHLNTQAAALLCLDLSNFHPCCTKSSVCWMFCTQFTRRWGWDNLFLLPL